MTQTRREQNEVNQLWLLHHLVEKHSCSFISLCVASLQYFVVVWLFWCWIEKGFLDSCSSILTFHWRLNRRTIFLEPLASLTMKFLCVPFQSCFCLQVSWIRYKDTSLLTVGRYTYTTDLRFEAFHSPHTDDWIVRLKNPRPSDSGFYGCQISTTPHRTQLVYLTVHGRSLYLVHKYVHLKLHY